MTTIKRTQTFVNSCLKKECLVSVGLKSSGMNGYGNGGTRDPTETLEMEWPHSPQTSRQHYSTSLDLESRW